MSIAGSEVAVDNWKIGILLDSETQFREGFLETFVREVPKADSEHTPAYPGARTQTQCVFEMLDREIGQASNETNTAAAMPPTCKAWVE